MVPRVGLQFVIVLIIRTDHTHLLFLDISLSRYYQDIAVFCIEVY